MNTFSDKWQPDNALIQRICSFAIPEHYIKEQVQLFNQEVPQLSTNQPDVFLKFVMARWRCRAATTNPGVSDESYSAAALPQATRMTTTWRPSEDTMALITGILGINQAFAEDAVPEFVIYWMERGTIEASWNGKFIQHVKNQWSRFNNLPQSGVTATPISSDWQPCNEAVEILRHANMDDDFIHKLVPEFILYWKETQRCYPSWNTKFIQHAKFKWAKQFAFAKIKRGNRHVDSNRPRSTRDIPLLENLLDRSWADGLMLNGSLFK